jgi:hypothetical protein
VSDNFWRILKARVIKRENVEAGDSDDHAVGVPGIDSHIVPTVVNGMYYSDKYPSGEDVEKLKAEYPNWKGWITP